MSAVSLDTAKKHMRIEGNDEDELISLYIDAAETWCGNYIDKPISDFDPVPADVKRAILCLVSFYFEVRDFATFGLSIQLTPHGVTSILDNYREKWFTDGE